jgi:probable FeS assembly SUF system protein SufT
MNYTGNDPLFLKRDVQVIAVPAGNAVSLPQGTEVVITQALGGSYTLMVPTYGGLFRLANKDADAIGKDVQPEEEAADRGRLTGEALEKEVWQTLKTCYDPEIPVNIVDLGLIYDLTINPLDGNQDGPQNRVEIKMTLTAQGCGMGASIAADAQNKLLEIPGIKEADVQIVWDPVWTAEKISPEGRTLLGIH